MPVTLVPAVLMQVNSSNDV